MAHWSPELAMREDHWEAEYSTDTLWQRYHSNRIN